MSRAERVRLRSHWVSFKKTNREDPSVFTLLHPSSYEGQFSCTKRKSLVPTPSHWLLCRFRLIASVTIGLFWSWWLWGPPLLLPLTEAVVDGRVASFSVGVPSGPTGRDNQAGQLQADRCIWPKLSLPHWDWGTFAGILEDHLSFFTRYKFTFVQAEHFFFLPRYAIFFLFPFAHKEEFQLNWKGGQIVCPWQNLYEP